MRPNALESINALRAGLAEVLTPELQSAYAQDTASTLQMLLESLAAEWDSAAADLHSDNQALELLLRDVRDALNDGNEGAHSLVTSIDETLAAAAGDSLVLSALSRRNVALRGALEAALVEIEDRIAQTKGSAALARARSAAYEHLRDVAARGWSFWDVASFREYMARYRAEQSQVTP